jgi:hypothetical protein
MRSAYGGACAATVLGAAIDSASAHAADKTRAVETRRACACGSAPRELIVLQRRTCGPMYLGEAYHPRRVGFVQTNVVALVVRTW